MNTIGEKAKYIRQAVQTRNHTCHWPGCDIQVKPAFWGCKRHWYKLPITLRTKIWAEYRVGQEEDGSPSLDYVKITNEVNNWIIKNHGEGKQL